MLYLIMKLLHHQLFQKQPGVNMYHQNMQEIYIVEIHIGWLKMLQVIIFDEEHEIRHEVMVIEL